MMRIAPATKKTFLALAWLGMLLVLTSAVWAGDTPPPATATAAGAAELGLLEAVFTGNIGLTIGLGLVIVAIWRGFVQGDMAGAVILAVIGVIITILPGVYNGLRNIACPLAAAFGGECGGGEAKPPKKT